MEAARTREMRKAHKILVMKRQENISLGETGGGGTDKMKTFY